MELPVLQPSGRPERADAARNRELILSAARRLFERHGPEGVSMDAVAAEAGVGKGTLYRRFGDRGGLALALLEAQETEFQEHLIRGGPPLGPGAPAEERLHAFGEAMLDMLERTGPVMLDAQRRTPGARYMAGPYAVYRTHVTLLLREALGPDAPNEYLADAVLATLTPELFLHHRRARELSLEDLAAGWHTMVEGLLHCDAR